MLSSGRLPSVQSHSLHTFSRSPQANIPRSRFNRSHGVKTTFDAGYLIPVFVDEVLPGDTFKLSMTAFARLATPVFPLMDNMYLESFFFYVPNRLLWNNWQRFNGEQDNPGDSTDYIVPYTNGPAAGTGWPEGSIGDYFGLPTQITPTTATLSFNALPFRAYNLIYNEWFRDENLQDSLDVPKDDGPDDGDLYNVVRRGKRYDYFTSCLPFPQKGPAVALPLGTSAPVEFNLAEGPPFTVGNQLRRITDLQAQVNQTGVTTNGTGQLVTQPSGAVVAVDPAGLWIADLSEATAASINSLRQAFQVQKLYERDARGGTRYTEIIRSHFGVISPDARLQRPEYLGGGSTPVIVNPIAQTSSTDGTSPQGNLAAVGTASVHGHGFVKSFTEHGYIIGLVCVRADLNYQQGVNRLWSRQTRFDFYWPALSHIGEQAVLNKEIYAQGTTADSDVFGYQERFAEYRYKPSLITGLFRSNATGSLDKWHLAQEFSSLPLLNDEFIVEDPPVDRVIAVPSQPHFIMDGFFNLDCARPMPIYSVPGLVDHF